MNDRLVRLVVEAHELRQRMEREGLGIGELAAAHGAGGTYVVRLLRLSYLAPDIVTAILAGRQPPMLTANTLQRDPMLPLNWADQRSQLGFG